MYTHHDPYQSALETKLFEQHWTTLDMENRQWPMMTPHTQGWLQFSRPWPFNSMEKYPLYTTVHGLVIDYKTGQAQLCLDSWSYDKPAHEKLFSGFDVQDVFERNLVSATLHLDPEDPTNLHFPLHTLRVSQHTAFWKSELFYTMLMTAQLLNALTTYQEVQSQFPYAQRSLDATLQPLPLHLREIITDFHQSSYPGAIYRFWVIADDTPFSETAKNQVTRLTLGEGQMSVRYERLIPNSQGYLERSKTPAPRGGWSVYCLKLTDIDKLNVGEIKLSDPRAILLTEYRNRVFYWENNTVTLTGVSINPQTFQQLQEAPQGMDSKIKVTADNEFLLYALVKSITQRVKRPHYYNPAYALALAFTQHYSELATYFPVLGRLRELSKLLVLVSYIGRVQQINQNNSAELEALILKTKHGPVPKPSADASMRYKKTYDLHSEALTLFAALRSVLPRLEQQWEKKWTKGLDNLKKQIGSIHISPYDPLVRKHIKRQTNEKLEAISSVTGWLQDFAMPENLSSPQEIAIALGQQKTKHFLRELNTILSQEVGTTPPETALREFLDDRPLALNKALCAQEKTNFLKKIQAKYPDSTQEEIEIVLSRKKHTWLLPKTPAHLRLPLKLMPRIIAMKNSSDPKSTNPHSNIKPLGIAYNKILHQIGTLETQLSILKNNRAQITTTQSQIRIELLAKTRELATARKESQLLKKQLEKKLKRPIISLIRKASTAEIKTPRFKRAPSYVSQQQRTLQRIVISEQRRRLNIELKKYQTVATGLTHLHLGKHSTVEPTANATCPWVRAPSSVAGSPQTLFAFSSIALLSNVTPSNNALPDVGQCVGTDTLFRYNRPITHEDNALLTPIKTHALLRLTKYPYHQLTPFFQLIEDTSHPNRDRVMRPLSPAMITKIVRDMTSIVTTGFHRNWTKKDYQKALQTLYLKLRDALVIDNHLESTDTIASPQPRSFS